MLLLSAVLSALLVAACDSGGGERSQPGPTASSTPAATTTTTNQTASNTNATANTIAKAKLNLNTASANDFRNGIPGLGNKMVHEFEEYRPYKSIQQFRREIGKYVDQAQVTEYEKYVYVPISENESDAETLRQIPGLDAGEAAELIAGRPYASRDAFLGKLGEKVSAEELNVARSYLGN